MSFYGTGHGTTFTSTCLFSIARDASVCRRFNSQVTAKLFPGSTSIDPFMISHFEPYPHRLERLSLVMCSGWSSSTHWKFASRSRPFVSAVIIRTCFSSSFVVVIHVAFCLFFLSFYCLMLALAFVRSRPGVDLHLHPIISCFTGVLFG